MPVLFPVALFKRWNSGYFCDRYFLPQVTGLYPVACTRNMYIVQRQLALDMIKWNVFDNHVEPDISFCKTLFEERVPMFLSNVHKYGSVCLGYCMIFSNFKSKKIILLSGIGKLIIFRDIISSWTLHFNFILFKLNQPRTTKMNDLLVMHFPIRTLKVPDNETDLELIYKYKDEWKQKYINKSVSRRYH